MKKIISLTLLAAAVTGCGHNIVTYMDGQEFNLAGVLVYRNGKIMQSNVKEHSNIKLDTDAKNEVLENNTSNTSSVTKMEIATGDQVTGYQVDLEKAKQKDTNE